MDRDFLSVITSCSSDLTFLTLKKSHDFIIKGFLKTIKVSTMMKKAKAEYQAIYLMKQNLLLLTGDYWKDIRNNKSKQTSPPIKDRDNGTLTTDDTETATILNDYFCTVAGKLIGPTDEIRPLHAHSRVNVDTPTMTRITISQKEIEEKICMLKVKKATGPDGVSARLLKYASMSIAPSLTSVFKQSVEAYKPLDQWKIARVRAAFKKRREQDRTWYRRSYAKFTL